MSIVIKSLIFIKLLIINVPHAPHTSAAATIPGQRLLRRRGNRDCWLLLLFLFDSIIFGGGFISHLLKVKGEGGGGEAEGSWVAAAFERGNRKSGGAVPD